MAGGRALIPKNAFPWPILAGLLFARVRSFSFPFSNFYFLVDRWLSGRSKLRHGRETAGLKTRHYKGLRQGRQEFAGGESVQGADAGGAIRGSQAAVAAGPAE